MSETRDDGLLTKPPFSAIAGLAAPIALSSLLEQLYNMVDSIVAGNFLGENAVAAVGASFSLCNVLVYAAIGCGIGAGVLAARRYGEGARDEAAAVIWTSVALFALVGLAIGVTGLPLADLILKALDTPPEALGDSCAYLAVYFVGLPALFALNAVTAMFNAIGDSRTPLLLLVISALINVCGDVASTAILGMGVPGIAISTVGAEYVAAVVGAAALAQRTRGWRGGKNALDVRLTSPIVRLAVPSVLQQATIAIGLMLVQSVVNSFGTASLAGFSAAMRVENVATVPTIALGSALSSFASQNLGAGRRDRVEEGYRVSQRAVAVTAITICIVYQLFCEQVISAFLWVGASEIAMRVGVDYMRFVGWCYALIGLKNVADGMLRGLGDTRIFTWANIINLGLRVGLAHLLAPTFGISATWWVVPLGWFVNFAVSHAGVVAWRTGKLKLGTDCCRP